MSKVEVSHSFEIVGSESVVAAFLAWVEDGAIDEEKMPLILLAKSLGLRVRQSRTRMKHLELDDSRVQD